MVRRSLLLVLALSVSVSCASAQSRSAVLDQGREVFFSQGCYGCHRIGIAGTPIANDLSHVGNKYSETELADWLRDPAKQRPTAHMPRLSLTEQEIRSVAAYLSSLH